MMSEATGFRRCTVCHGVRQFDGTGVRLTGHPEDTCTCVPLPSLEHLKGEVRPRQGRYYPQYYGDEIDRCLNGPHVEEP